MKENILLGHRPLPIDHFTHNNQPETGGRDGWGVWREGETSDRCGGSAIQSFWWHYISIGGKKSKINSSVK